MIGWNYTGEHDLSWCKLMCCYQFSLWVAAIFLIFLEYPFSLVCRRLDMLFHYARIALLAKIEKKWLLELENWLEFVADCLRTRSISIRQLQSVICLGNVEKCSAFHAHTHDKLCYVTHYIRCVFEHFTCLNPIKNSSIASELNMVLFLNGRTAP